jgi:beta-barrel assembly-enhancing protease
MSFKAIAYHDDFADGRISGQIKIEGDKLIFFNAETELIIYKKDARLDMGGTAGRQIFIRSSQNSYKFSTADGELLKTDFFAKNQNLAKHSKTISNKRSFAKISLISVFALFVISLVSLIVFRKTVVKYIAKGIPYSLEQQLGETYISQLSITETLDSTSQAYKILDAKIKLLQADVDPTYAIKTYIVETDEINAFALPGGFLVFNSELLKKADSWEEVLGVASHEIAHVTQQHHARGILSRVGVFTIVSLLFGDGSALTDLVFGAGASLESLSYSRDFETESDLKGFEYLMDAKINPKGLRTFFAKLDQESKFAKNIPEFLSTHPSNTNRIEDIQKLEKLKENQITFRQLGDYKVFKVMLKDVAKAKKTEQKKEK